MLGIGKSKPEVEFSAHGKHPAFDDYFNLNTDSPLASAVSSWIEKGTKLEGNQKKNRTSRSFRFWMRGIKKEDLVLGIIRDSSDRMGRPYPLLIMGKGGVKGWDKEWQYIFRSYEPVFRSFEEMTASQFDGFKAFETRLLRLDFTASPSAGGETGAGLPEAMLAWFGKDRERGVLVLPVATVLDRAGTYHGSMEKSGWFKRKPAVPGAVFLGGLPENPVLTIFTRPLNADDFLRLFNG